MCYDDLNVQKIEITFKAHISPDVSFFALWSGHKTKFSKCRDNMETAARNRLSRENATVPHNQARQQLLGRVGKTPLLDISRISPVPTVKILAKAEWMNPGGSIKDRAALSMLLDGESSGRLTHAKTILDASSGNTGIAYAMLGAVLGYRVKLVIPANAGKMFKTSLMAYGADLVFSDPQLGSDGAILEARRVYKEDTDSYFYADQYNNPANWWAHYLGTGKEIIEQTSGAVTHFVAGLGTSGTFMGTSKWLKENDPNIRVIAMQPDSPFHGLEGLKHMQTAIVPGFYDPALADENVAVTTEEAQLMVKRLAREEGLLVGLSSGAAAVAALTAAKTLTSGVVVTIFPDSACKYFDQKFWETEHGDT